MQFKNNYSLLLCSAIMLFLAAVASHGSEPAETETTEAVKQIPEIVFDDNFQFGLSVLTAARFTSTNGEISKNKFQLRIVRITPTFRFDHVNWTCKANYRFYLQFNAVREAYCQHRWNTYLSLTFGIVPTLIGHPGYASSSFWGPLPFYYGLQGDRDVGSYLTITRKRWKLELGYYFSDEYGDGSRLDRSTFDTVNSPFGAEKESGAIAGRWTFHDRNLQLYVSAQKQKTEQINGNPTRQRLSMSFDQKTSFSNWEFASTLGYYKFRNRAGSNIGRHFLAPLQPALRWHPRPIMQS